VWGGLCVKTQNGFRAVFFFVLILTSRVTEVPCNQTIANDRNTNKSFFLGLTYESSFDYVNPIAILLLVLKAQGRWKRELPLFFLAYKVGGSDRVVGGKGGAGRREGKERTGHRRALSLVLMQMD
jgi:hypothetical protein